MTRILSCVFVVSFLAVSFLGANEGSSLVFTDVSAGAGIGFAATNTESLAWGDYDNDGDQDLYLTQDAPNVLLRNDGGGSFTDVSVAAGVDHPGFSVGAAFGDLDNDGDVDLYVVSFGSGPDVLYRNDGEASGYGFTDVTLAAGVTDASSSRGVALLDYDADGLLDIYVNAIGPDLLYHNLGGLVFENVAGALGVATVGQGVGAVASDLDGDGRIDLFTGNRSSDLNRLYLNGESGFTDVTVSRGIDKVGLGMGVLAFDYDNDLDMDLYWTTWPGSGAVPVANAFYENLGGAVFADVAGLTGTEDPLGWGISCNTADIDNDGYEDFFVTNGFSVTSGPNVLFRNQGDKTFADVTSVLGGGAFDGRGVAFADFDNDGDSDLCVTGGPGAATRLWRNDTPAANRWLVLELVGTLSNRSAIGARVEVETDLETTVKEVSGGAGRGSQNSLPLEFGLGAATMVSEIRVRWPSGWFQTLTDVAMDQKLSVVESVEIFRDNFESGSFLTWPLSPASETP